MISRSTLIDIEKLIRISVSRIVWRLLSVIFIPIFSIVTLLSVNNAFCIEPLEFKTVAGIYDNADYITNLKRDQAILITSSYPAGPLQNIEVVTYIDLVNKTYDFSKFKNSGSLGRYYNDSSTNIRYYASLMDSKYLYTGAVPTLSLNTYLSRVNAELQKIGLGSVNSRFQRINFLNSNIAVFPVNFSSYLGSWVLIGIFIFIAIPPLWWIVKRFIR